MSLPAFTSHTMDSGLDLELNTVGGSTVSENYTYAQHFYKFLFIWIF